MARASLPKMSGEWKAYINPAEEELERTIYACAAWEESFHEEGLVIGQRIAELVSKCRPEEVMELAVKAREDLHLRHAPMLLLCELSRRGAVPGLRETITRCLRRPDDTWGRVSMELDLALGPLHQAFNR